MKPQVRLYTSTGTEVGSFDDEELDDALEIIRSHLESSDTVIIIGAEIPEELIP